MAEIAVYSCTVGSVWWFPVYRGSWGKIIITLKIITYVKHFKYTSWLVIGRCNSDVMFRG